MRFVDNPSITCVPSSQTDCRYCPAHARKAALMRHKAALKAKPTDSVRDTLEELDFYRPDSTKSVPEVPPSIATKILGKIWKGQLYATFVYV